MSVLKSVSRASLCTSLARDTNLLHSKATEPQGGNPYQRNKGILNKAASQGTSSSYEVAIKLANPGWLQRQAK